MTPMFSPHDPEAGAFFDAHGYAVLAPQLSSEETLSLHRGLEALWTRFAAEQGLPVHEYLANISQWRDLWRCDDGFREVLADGRIWSIAARFMGRPGARLLHDHVIIKPAHASGTVPWHQDYPYWPVDTDEGLSCWCPLADVGPEGGCLEVVDGSHRWGESPPADFLANDHRAFDARADLMRLPAPTGSVVVLHSLTWHRTGPNRDVGHRAAYISLWLPPDARYAPEHSRWHPVNEHVTVGPGEILNDDWFPCFGERDVRSSASRPLVHRGPAPSDGLSMFNASTKIAAQLRAILARAGHAGGPGGGLAQMLADDTVIVALICETIASGVAVPGSEDALADALRGLRVASDAYRLHRARNVYNGAYATWWEVAGAGWEARLCGDEGLA